MCLENRDLMCPTRPICLFRSASVACDLDHKGTANILLTRSQDIAYFLHASIGCRCHLSINDNAIQHQFEMLFTSRSNWSICLGREAWPAAPLLPLGFDAASVQTNQGIKHLLPNGSVYCPGGCASVTVAPGQSLHGVIAYSAFEGAELIEADPNRALRFEVFPTYCSKK